jgi:2-methylcitrate dehydratase PrpD
MGPTASRQLAEWARGLRLGDIPDRVVAHAHSQIVSELAAVRAGVRHTVGRRLVAAFGPLRTPDPGRRAALLGALGVCLDYDDTAYAGHVSHSCVTVPVAYARRAGLDGAAVLTATVAANEVAARVTAAATLGPLRGQLAAHTHLAGAVTARLRAEGAPVDRWVAAYGLAYALPPWPVHRACLGSDAKALVAAVPVRTALEAVDAALAGLDGPPDVWEHPDGFLAAFADVALPEALTAGLGERWHTETLSYKRYPVSAYLSAAVDCAVRLHGELGPLRAEDVAEVVVHGSLLTVGLQRGAGAYVDGPRTPVAALNYSVGYGIATALLTGDLTPADLDTGLVEDAGRWALAGRVRVEHDPVLSMAVLASTAPLGAALKQAGRRALPWLAERARQAGGPGLPDTSGALPVTPPEEDFRRARKAVGARVRVTLADGRTAETHQEIAYGAAGGPGHAGHRDLSRRKFLGTGGAPAVADDLARLVDLPAGRLADVLDEALADLG